MKNKIFAKLSIIAFVIFITVLCANAQPSGLVSYWAADGNTDDVVGGNNGTLLNGAGYRQGRFGQAFNFDGVDDLFQAPTTGFQTGNSDRTMMMWVKVDAFVAQEAILGAYGNLGSFSQIYGLGISGNTSFFSQWGTGVSGPSLQTGRWYHIAVTNVGSHVTLYLDGAIVNYGDFLINTPAGTMFYSGGLPDPYGEIRKLKGSVDDIAVFNRALSASEIQTLSTEEVIPPHSWWKAEGNANDSVGTNHGTLQNGATFAPGVEGQAFKFDGVDDYVSVPNSSSLNFGTGDFTVSFWAKFNNLGNNGNGLIHKDNYGSPGAYKGWLFNICDDCAGSPGIGLETRNIGQGIDNNARFPTSNFQTGKWYNIVGMRQSNILYLYVDGVLRATVPETSPTDLSNDIELNMGSLSLGSRQFFNGLLDEVNIYNRALSATEIVELSNIDKTAPVISNIPSSQAVEATGGNGATVSWNNLTAIDAVDGAVDVICSPSSGSTFAIGATTISCSASDSHGNASMTATFTVTVRDTTAPVISNMPLSQTVEAASANGANLSWSSPTATDTVDGAIAVNCDRIAGSTFALGTNTVTCTATDAYNNSSQSSFAVTVSDTIAPIISNVPANQTVVATSANGADVFWSNPTGVDLVDGTVLVTCIPTAGSNFAIGATKVICTASDHAGNTATGSFNVNVNKANQTINFGVLTYKTFGNAPFTVAATGGASGNPVIFSTTGNCSSSGINGSIITITGAGSCTVTASQTGSGAYNEAPIVQQSFIINKATLIVAANSVTRAYGYPNPVLNASFSGFQNGDTLFNSGITGSPALSTTAFQYSAVGSYPIIATLGSLSANNYQFTFVNGSLSVYLTGVVGLDSITISASKAYTDSFDSAVGYPASKSNQSIILSNGTINLKGANSFGSLVSAAGSVVLESGSLVTGDVRYSTTLTNSGTVQGTIAQQTAPIFTAAMPTPCSSYRSASSGSNNWISGSYSYDAVKGDLTVSGGNTATLADGSYCFNNITLSGGSTLVVNGSVILNLKGKLNASGGSLVNTTMLPANLQISSSYMGNNGVVMSGGSGTYALIYAPGASVVLSGGSSLFGAVLCKTLTGSGDSIIHQDTNLSNIWGSIQR